MYFMLKLTILLILYLKLNDLSAIPLIESHKLSASIEPLSASVTNSDGSDKEPNDNEFTVATKTKTTKNKSTTINALKINSQKQLPVSPAIPIATTTTTTTTASTVLQENNKNSFGDVDGIFYNYSPIINDKKKSENNIYNNKIHKYFYYNISNKNDNDSNDIVKSLKNNNYDYDNEIKNSKISPTSSNSTKPPYVNDLLPFDLNFNYDNIDGKSSNGNENEENDDDDTIEDADFSKEWEIGLGNILLNTINNSETDRFLFNYNIDEGSTCLLDIIKENLMWWSNNNGTLREETIFNFTTRRSYLDLSYRNIKNDDQLFSRTRSHKYWHRSDIIVFSAAQNNLTHAPYQTLTLMNSTLKYLTLKGNQFAAYTPEMQKEAISRFINDTQRHCDNLNETDTTLKTPNTDPNTDYTEIDDDSDTRTTIEPEEYRSLGKRYKKLKHKLLGKPEEGIAWATFPLMPALLELDISNCHIEFITRDAFKNLTNLRRLFLSHNKMLTIPGDSFHHLQKLQYLDLSFIRVLDSDYQISLPTAEAIYNLIYGLKIQQKTFQNLPELIYLDLSHTKLTRNSAMAITHLGEKLRYMSLCYTSFPMVSNALFKNTGLIGLDLSGNPYAAYNIIEDSFEGISDTLKYLYFDRSNIKDLAWLRYLTNVRILGLSANNINSVSLEVFSPLKNLQLLDLSSNHIGNWYNRVFTHNEQLRVLNLRDNNVNIITSEMLRDFQLLDYLSLGDNNFVCDCLLRDLVDIANANNKDAECSQNVLPKATEILMDNAYLVEDYLRTNLSTMSNTLNSNIKYDPEMKSIIINISPLLVGRRMPRLQQSYENLKKSNHRPKIRYATQLYSTIQSSSSNTRCPAPEPISVHEKLNSSSLKFQLLDYEDEHYWCFNETERLHFMQLNCGPRNYVEDLTRKLHTLTKYVVGSVVSVLGVSLIGVLVYLKRWHIHYYFSYLKSAALVSVAAKEAADQLNNLAETDPNLVYDIFISYCQSDRQWVLEELLPNVEESGDISICMHERDFQIGLTILDNIVSCMDRSRALMLIISSNFLLSHWCQFEMHLAQHRIFEVSKEHLILVFLEDIPRSKRPKTLQYLMEVKTYIKWPSSNKNADKTPSADERKFFWKRLKRSLENIGLHPYPRPRESHA